MLLLRALLVRLVRIGSKVWGRYVGHCEPVPLVGDLPARQIGVLTGSALIFGVAWVFVRGWGGGTMPRLVAVGLLWVAIMVLFEIRLWRLVLGLSSERRAEDYDPARGVFLAFGRLFMAVSPLLAARLRGRSNG